MKRWLFKLVVFPLLGAVVNVAVAWGCAVWVKPSDLLRELAYESSSLGINDRVNSNAYMWKKPGATRLFLYSGLSSASVNGGTDSLSTPESVSQSHFAEATAIEREVEKEFYQYPSLNNNKFEVRWGWTSLMIIGLSTDRWPDSLESFTAAERPRWLSSSSSRLVKYTLIEDGRGWPLIALRCRYVLDLESKQLGYRVQGAFRLEPGSGTYGHAWFNLRSLPWVPVWSGFLIDTLIYSTFVWLIALLVSGLRRATRQRRGFCTACGYDLRGAKHEVCPECGVEV